MTPGPVFGVSGRQAESERILMRNAMQSTISTAIEIAGHGVHTAAPVTIKLRPADVNSGIRFLRTGLPGGRERLIEARHSQITPSDLCTILGDAESGSVSTIEHLMAALYALEIDNVLVEIDGPEAPIMDGSSAPFIEMIDRAGIRKQNGNRRFIKVLKRLRIAQGERFAELLPFSQGFRLTVEIKFDAEVIGHQKKTLDLSPLSFRRELAGARTFGFLRDVEKLRLAGFAHGASLDNTVAIGDDGILNPEGLRYPDEFVRHKMLDAVGDLSLAGLPILGHYRSYVGGHKLNVSMLTALFSDRSAYAIVEAGKPVARPVDAAAMAPALAVLSPELN
jgi:UDP-3-O-[3-hydroxymyristoyl] N-acetylglucosamine deacetylase